MPIAKPKTTEKDVSVEIDLESLIGPAARNEVVREVFFQQAFDRMMNRLDNGLDYNNRPMKGYSKSYKESLAFAAFGKSDTVNMQLTKDMVNSLVIQKDDPKKFKLGFTGKENNIKAFAHMTGYEGHPHLDGKVKPRLFFGFSDKELKEIARDIKGTVSEAQFNEQQLGQALRDEALLALIDRLLA